MYTGWPTRGKAAIHLLHEGVDHPDGRHLIPTRAGLFWNTRELDVEQVETWFSEKTAGGEPSLDISLYRVEVMQWLGDPITLWLVEAYLRLKMTETIGEFSQRRVYRWQSNARVQFANLRTLVRSQIG